ncbi:unnamed protein product [Ascophyllum nodosum]
MRHMVEGGIEAKFTGVCVIGTLTRQAKARINQGRDGLFSQPPERDRVMRVPLVDVVAT